MKLRVFLILGLFCAQALGMDKSRESTADYCRLELAGPSMVLRAVPVVREYTAPVIPSEPATSPLRADVLTAAVGKSPLNSSSDSDSPTPKSLEEQFKELFVATDRRIERLPFDTFDGGESTQAIDGQAKAIFTQEVSPKADEKELEPKSAGVMVPDIESAFTAQELAKLKQPVAAPGKDKEPDRIIVPETCFGKIKNWFRNHRTGLVDTAELLTLAAVSGGTSYVGYCMLDNEAIPSLVSFASGERAEEVTQKYGNAGLRMLLAFGPILINDNIVRTNIPGLLACVKSRGYVNTFDQPFNMYLTHTAVNGVQKAFRHPSDQARQALNIPNRVRDRLLQVIVR